MKKIIFFSKDLHIGGMEKALVNLLNRLSENGMNVTLLLESSEGELLGDLNSDVCVKEYSLSKCRIALLRRLLNFIHRKAWRMLNRNKYDFSCAFCTYSVLGSRLAVSASKNSALYIHSDYFAPNRDTHDADILARLDLERFSHLIFVSNESKNRFLAYYEKYADKCKVINNLIDIEAVKRNSLQAVTLPEMSHPIFAFVGRIEEESKRLSRLLEAFSAAAKKLPDARLLIVGGGKDVNACRNMAESLGLLSSVIFVGEQKNPYPYMRMADCIVLTSDYEGFPMLYYEALVLDKNIITTQRVSDDVIDIGDHAIIAEKTAQSLAEAMLSDITKTENDIPIGKFNQQHLSAIISLIENKY